MVTVAVPIAVTVAVIAVTVLAAVDGRLPLQEVRRAAHGVVRAVQGRDGGQ